MAVSRYTYQHEHTVSIKRDQLMNIAQNQNLSKKDLRVLLMLLTQLNGWCTSPNSRSADPLNFKKIDIGSIADALDMSKKEVKASIKNLMDEYLIEPGDNEAIKNGYRFTF